MENKLIVAGLLFIIISVFIEHKLKINKLNEYYKNIYFFILMSIAGIFMLGFMLFIGFLIK